MLFSFQQTFSDECEDHQGGSLSADSARSPPISYKVSTRRPPAGLWPHSSGESGSKGHLPPEKDGWWGRSHTRHQLSRTNVLLSTRH